MTADDDRMGPDSSLSSSRPLPDGGAWGLGRRSLTVGLLLTVAAWAFEALAVATVLPAMIDDLGGLHLYGWIFGAFFLANLVGVVVAGGEADRLGPTGPFVAGIALFAAGLLLGGFAPTIGVLIAARAVQGFGSGLLASVAYSVVGRGYPESARPRMIALMSTAWVVPGLIGPALAGLIADFAGWRWVFFGILPLPLLAIVLALPAMRQIGPGVVGQRDLARIRRAVLLALGMTALLAGLGQPTLPRAVPLVIIGGLIALPSLRNLLPPGTLRAAPGPAAAIAAIALLNFGFFGAEAFVPLALTDLRGQSPTFVGLPLTAATIAWTTGSWVLDRRAGRGNRRGLVRLGLILVALGIALMGIVLIPGTPVLIAAVAWGVAGLGIGLAYSTIQLVILETAPPGQEGKATSSMQLANTVAIALGTGIGGVLVGAFSAGDAATTTSLVLQGVLMIGVIVLGILIAGRIPGRLDAREEGPRPLSTSVSAAVPENERLPATLEPSR